MNDLIQIGWSLYGACVRYAVNIHSPDNPNLCDAAVKTQPPPLPVSPPSPHPRVLTLLFGKPKKRQKSWKTPFITVCSAAQRQRHRDQSGCRLLIPTTQPLINCAIL